MKLYKVEFYCLVEILFQNKAYCLAEVLNGFFDTTKTYSDHARWLIGQEMVKYMSDNCYLFTFDHVDVIKESALKVGLTYSFFVSGLLHIVQ